MKMLSHSAHPSVISKCRISNVNPGGQDESILSASGGAQNLSNNFASPAPCISSRSQLVS
jgi:hypothetical protein